MKAVCLSILLFCSIRCDGADNSIIFPRLLSVTNSVLMLNAEFRVISGTRVIFRSDEGYQSFEASNLNEQVLSRLGITVSQLESNKAALAAKQQAAIAAQATYQKRLASLAGTNQDIQITVVYAGNYEGMRRCIAVIGGENREIMVNNLPASVPQVLNKYNQLKTDVAQAEVLLENYTRSAKRADAVAPIEAGGNAAYVNSEMEKRKQANLMLVQADEYAQDVNKLKRLLDDSTKDLQANTTIKAFPTGLSYSSLPIWQCGSKP